MMKHKNQNIQALRGICALMVFLSHTLSVKDIPYVRCLMESPLHLLFDGQIAVVVFFTLSGYYYYKESTLTYEAYSNGIKKKGSENISSSYMLVINRLGNTYVI